MYPIFLKFGVVTVYSYGVMVAIGFALAAALIYRRAERFGIDKDKAVDLAIIILISGILGARGLYVLLNLPFYLANPVEIVMLSKGGLVWYGGFILSLAAVIIYIRMNSLDIWAVVDLIAPYAALAQSFGRIGCFLNGCCYGIKMNACAPLAVTFPSGADPRLPVQLISAGLLFLIFLILLVRQAHRRFGGEIFFSYCMLYSLKRFAMEFLRGDNPRVFLGLTMSQLISVLVFIAALILFLHKARLWKKSLTISKS
ncbi:MAG: prolipoprotein diacylglyceryl transferase [Candidatus Omnitrophota bacterium]